MERVNKNLRMFFPTILIECIQQIIKFTFFSETQILLQNDLKPFIEGTCGTKGAGGKKFPLNGLFIF